MAGRKRLDPVLRAADGRNRYDKIGGKDPNRHYVLTNPNDEQTGTAHYENELGYQVETVRAGGPSTAASRNATPGAKVTSGGQVLVSCPLEEFQAREAEGQALSGALERRILKDGGVEDGMRGRGYEISVERDRGYAGEEA